MFDIKGIIFVYLIEILYFINLNFLGVQENIFCIKKLVRNLSPGEIIATA